MPPTAPSTQTPERLEARTRDHLEWDLVLESFAEHCLSAAAARHLQNRKPAGSLAQATQLMELTRQALRASAAEEPAPQLAFPDMEDVLARTRKGSLATGAELRGISDMLLVASRLRSYAKQHAQQWPLLCTALDSAPSLDTLQARLEGAVDKDGSILDAASKDLRDARRQAGEIRREVQKRLQNMLERYRPALRDDYYAERDGRYVLPVRSDSHVKVQGVVLGSSASGGTLYVEPQELTGEANRLQLAEAAVEREEAKVLDELSRLVQEASGELQHACESCTRADELGAITRWAKRTRASAVQLTTRPTLSLFGVRHPLLAVRDAAVVPNDVALAGGKALIVSGPNAGGKTALLKCIGVSVLMAKTGLPIPAEASSVVGWFGSVYADMGDDQSLTMSLSTFSAHVTSLAGIAVHSADSSLALLDEVAAGTDPEEGSALAAALIEALVSKGAAVVATTHYERLKELAASSVDLQNGSVGFDLETLSPTYRLAVGAPGPSTALIVAERFGMPEGVVQRARELLPVDSVDREALVQALQAERARLEKAAKEAEEHARRQEQLRHAIEEEKKTLREKERARLERSSQELMADLQEARHTLRAVRGRIKSQELLDATELRRLERAIDDAAKPVALGGAAQRAMRALDEAASAPIGAASLVPGTRVFLPRLGAQGVISGVSERGQLTVQVGALKLKASAEDVVVASPAAPPQGSKQASARRRQEPREEANTPRTDALRTSSNTVNLRGQRVDEALDEIDRFIDGLLRRGEPSGFVLHGHGTGALKLAVRSHLAAHPLVSRSRPAERDEGGDAFSVFWLDGSA